MSRLAQLIDKRRAAEAVLYGVNMEIAMAQNQRKAQSDNKSSGLLGVTWNKQHKKWQSKIMVNKVYHHVGLFDCSEVAHAAYIEKKRQLHVGCTI